MAVAGVARQGEEETMYRDALDRYFEQHRTQLVQSIQQLISIRSVRSEPQPGLPFGPGPAAALSQALNLAERLGCRARNFDNYVGTVDLNEQETTLGILVHVDVVEEGINWTIPPFAGILRDGRIYGRGATDDKGPTVAALYALAAVKELGIPLRQNARLLIGTDQEGDFADLAHYFRQQAPPPLIFSADGAFPVVNAEKGALRASFSASWPEEKWVPRIVSVRSGDRINLVPAEATAVTLGLEIDLVREFCSRVGQVTGAVFTVSAEGHEVHIAVQGVGGPAFAPEQGINALTALLTALAAMPFTDSVGFHRLQNVVRVFPHGDHQGRAAGIAMRDDQLGELTITLSCLEYGPTGLSGLIDSRTPHLEAPELTADILGGKLQRHGLELQTLGLLEPHHASPSSDFVRLLLRVYEDYTGNPGYCLCSGAETYMHSLDGGVCFGCTLPGSEDGRAHGPDEYARVDDLILAAKIYAQVIIDLCL